MANENDKVLAAALEGKLIGKTAKPKSPYSIEKPYTVEGTWMDSNGCTYTHGHGSDGRECKSFVDGTSYID